MNPAMARKPKRKSPEKKRSFENRPLSGLAKLKKKTGNAPAPPAPVPPKPEQDTSDDDRLFQEAMAGVAPMANDGPAPRPKKKRPATTGGSEDQEAREVVQALQDLVDGESPLSIHETDEAIEGSAEGLDPRILRKLRRGEFSVQDHLDLHGYNREEAKTRVESFLLDALAHGKRCLLIIHGRGHGSKDHIPVLKNALKSWFTRRALRKKILAFTTARACDGGAGAVYVLLRKSRT
jgi:DNA-nicking Smr family endonuclease